MKTDLLNYYSDGKAHSNEDMIDEFFLLDFTPEEYQNYLKDIKEYSYRHHRFKHYRDKVSGVIPDFSYLYKSVVSYVRL